ncbi:MAG: hypothetical protein KY468_05520 [Armatimonadetes bacterium]|nr:hypothetical protein [Armatimonadota bacterium]
MAGEDASTVRELFGQEYQGSRYSFGYPACPNLEDPAKLWTILQPERIGVTLSEEFQIEPEQSTSAIIVHPPRPSTSRWTDKPLSSRCYTTGGGQLWMNLFNSMPMQTPRMTSDRRFLMSLLRSNRTVTR